VKVGLVIPVFNRAVYLRQTLASVATTRHPFVLYLVDDASGEPAAIKAFNEFTITGGNVIKKVNPENQNMFNCLRQGWKHLAGLGCDVLANLDSDAIVKPDWLDVLLGLHARFKDRIVSGFNTDVHPIWETFKDYHLKNTVGGINLVFGTDLLPTVESCLVDERWDWRLCKLMQNMGRPIVVSRPSVVQHIGQRGLHSQDDRFDFARDFDDGNESGELAAQGKALAEVGKTADAIEVWERALFLRPDLPEVHAGLGRALLSLRKPVKSIEHLRQAIRLRPGYGEALNTLGFALRGVGDVEGAASAFEQSIEADPRVAEPYCNLGTALYELGRPREAIARHEKAIELQPDFGGAHLSLGLALLADGQWERGWREFEWRSWKTSEPSVKRCLSGPQWDGGELRGRTLVVVCEQGLGDTLQFVRYVPLLAGRGASVIVECQPALRDILQSVEGISQLVAYGDPLPSHDLQVRLMSLPHLFGTRMGNIPRQIPYIRADAGREAMWKSKLTGGGFKIGINWQGNKTFSTDRMRSIPLAAFEPLARIEGVRLHSLQRKVGLDQIAQTSSRFTVNVFEPPLDKAGGAFVDTAAVMRHLDLVITSDTSIAHLAGALGVRVWLALSDCSDWRWLRDRDDSPWYPTMRIFRQSRLGDWPGVFNRMAIALRDTLHPQEGSEPLPILAPMAPGELLDRLSILQIKIERIRDQRKLAALRRELGSLTAIRDRLLPHGEQINQLARELRQVNEILWQTEDDIRAADGGGDFGDRFVELAKTVYRTNDRRSAIKKQVNVLLGSAIGDEKQYGAMNEFGGLSVNPPLHNPKIQTVVARETAPISGPQPVSMIRAASNGAGTTAPMTAPHGSLDFRGKSIVLVGNRRPECDWSNLIEAHDFVFRFSYMTFIRTGLVGRRTDGIHVEATTEYQNSLAKGPAEFCNAGWLADVRLVTMRRRWYSMKVLEALKVADREFLIIDDSLSAHVARPTSGYNLILNVLHHPFFQESTLSICCFTTDEAETSADLDWHQRSLAQERREINTLVRAGSIRQLDRAQQTANAQA
jgi:tetratricopeptide (TPR) repeat protein